MPIYPPNAAHFDANQVPTIMGVIGTLGTADTAGTASPLPFGVDPTTGAAYVNVIQGSISIGTIAEDLTVTSGTITRISTIGTLEVGTMTNTGTNVNVVTGTMTSVSNLVAGTLSALAAGTITGGTLSNLVSGTINALASGTIAGGTLQNLVSGTVNALASGTITAGTVSVTVGSVVGPNASGGTSTTAPVQIGGTTATGTVYTMLVDTAGNPQVDVVSVPQVSVGTIPQVSVGTLPTINITTGTLTTGSITNIAMLHAGTVNASLVSSTGTIPLVTTVSNLTNGSVNVLTGTTTLVSTVTTLSNLTNGSINVLTGTIQSAGTVTGVGVVSALSVGTVGGKAASGAAAVQNPVLIGGTDSGGTVYSMLVDLAGNPQVDVLTIPQVSVGTIPQVSVGTLPTLNLTTGTITTGSITNVAQVYNAGTLAAGANNIGDVDIATGTVTLISTVTDLMSGSVRMTVGTLTAGSLTNLGQVHNAGTVQAGTVQIDSKPVTIGTSYGTLGTTGAAVIGTLVAAAGAGTYQYVSGLAIVVAAGTVDCAITNVGTVAGPNGAGVLARGQFTPGGGIVRAFNPAMRSGTNGTIGYWMGGAGTAYFTVDYWNAT